MSREEKLAEFVGWAQHHITGDETSRQRLLALLLSLLPVLFGVAVWYPLGWDLFFGE